MVPSKTVFLYKPVVFRDYVSFQWGKGLVLLIAKYVWNCIGLTGSKHCSSQGHQDHDTLVITGCQQTIRRPDAFAALHLHEPSKIPKEP